MTDENTTPTTVIDMATGQSQTPQPVDIAGNAIPTPDSGLANPESGIDSGDITASHHHILHGVVVALESFGRMLEKDFGELATEIKALASKIAAKIAAKL